MSQCILLREKNDLLNSLIGQSFNEKNKFEAEKILNEIHSIAENRSIDKKVLCYIVKNGLIRGVGGSTLMMDKNGKIFSNLILDQFGIFLAEVMRANGTPAGTVLIKNFSGANQTMKIWGVGQLYNNFTNSGAQVQVGSGSTPPARTDFNIETPFGTAPESLPFNAVSSPVFNSGLGNFKFVASISAGFQGTINESCLINNWGNSGGSNTKFFLFRDIISPAKAFIAGQTIALEYTIQL